LPKAIALDSRQLVFTVQLQVSLQVSCENRNKFQAPNLQPKTKTERS
jgi:hypothetical protein